MQLEVHSLTLAYEGKPPVFRGVDLQLGPGDLVVIRGPSGSGKSSLLRLLNRLQEPTGGSIVVDRRPVAEHDVTWLRRRIGYVQQSPVMVPGSVRDNLLLPFTFQASGDAGLPPDDSLRGALDRHRLAGVSLDDDATQLSVGQKQRVALLRTLFTAPEIILCDEPTSALDPEAGRVVLDEIVRQTQERGAAVILVTHAETPVDRARPRSYILTPEGMREASA